jgi:hypothetical protein
MGDLYVGWTGFALLVSDLLCVKLPVADRQEVAAVRDRLRAGHGVVPSQIGRMRTLERRHERKLVELAVARERARITNARRASAGAATEIDRARQAHEAAKGEFGF